MRSLNLAGSITADDVDLGLRRLELDRKASKSDTLQVNLTRLDYLDPFSLSVLLGGLTSFNPKGETVLRPPASPPQRTKNHEALNSRARILRENLRAFLSRGIIRNVIEECGITFAEEQGPASKLPPGSPFEVRFLRGNDEFNDFVERIARGQQLPLFWKDAWGTLHLKKKGKLRDVFLYELGRNVLEHSTTADILFSISTQQGSSRRSEPWAKRFHAALQGTQYLELVVSDFGVGIVRSLADVYSEITKRPDSKGSRELAEDVVGFSLQAYGTRKSNTERLQQYAEILRADQEHSLLPPTGLYWVKEICRELGGLLAVRTDTVLVYYDFLSNPDQELPQRHSYIADSHGRTRRRLSRPRISGAHLLVRIPIATSTSVAFPQTFTQSQSSEVSARKAVAIMSQYGSGLKLQDESSHAEFILSVVDEVKELRQLSGEKTLVLDLHGIDLGTKPLFLLAVELMRLQDSRNNIVLLNADQIAGFKLELDRFLLGEARSQFGFPRERPIIAFDSQWKLHMVGVDQAVEQAVASRLVAAREGERQSSLSISDLRKNRLQHVLSISGDNGELRWLFSLKSLRRVARGNLERNIRELLLQTGVFYPGDWFLLPSGSYSHGFFDLRKALGREEIRRLTRRWLGLVLETTKPDTLVIAGVGYEELAAVASTIRPEARIVGLEAWNTIDGLNEGGGWLRLALLPTRSRVAVLCGAIGTARTLSRVLESLPEVDVVGLISILDCRESDAGGTDQIVLSDQVPLFAAVHYPLSYDTNLPKGCTYRDIVVVDRVSSSPVFEAEGVPVLQSTEKELFSILLETEALALGHYAVADRHVCQLVLTDKLNEIYANEFAERILRDVDKQYTRRNESIDISHVAFAEGSRSEGVVNALAERLRCDVLMLRNEQLRNPSRFPWSHTAELRDVLLYHNAVSTGEGTWRLLDLLSHWKATRILSYALLRRVAGEEKLHYEKVANYSGAELDVAYLFDLKIPAFTPSTCPVCERSHRLREALRKLRFGESQKAAVLSDLDFYPLHEALILRERSALHALVPETLSMRLLELELRILLEQARHTATPIPRKELANRVRKDSDGTVTEALCRILTREETLLLTPFARSEIFYRTFRDDLVERIELYLIQLAGREGDTKRLAELSTVLSYLDPRRLAFRQGILRGHLSADTVRFLLAGGVSALGPSFDRQQRQLEPFERELRFASLSPTLPGGSGDRKEVPPFLGGGDRDTDTLRFALLQISPSAGPNWPCLHIQTIVRGYRDGSVSKGEIISTLGEEWTQVVRRFRRSILPGLNEVAAFLEARQTGMAAAESLREMLIFLDLVLGNLEDLRQEVLAAEGESLAATASEFIGGVETLRRRLLSDDEESVYQSLMSVVVEVRAVVRRVVTIQWIRDLLEEKAISIKADLPDSPCFAFCEREGLVRAVANLLENLGHAFPEAGGKTQRRACIAVVKDEEKGIVRVRVFDNGSRADELHPGVGLMDIVNFATVHEGSFIPPRGTEEPGFATEAGFDLQLIREELIGTWTRHEY